MAQRQLYGGAITTHVPPTFIDASDLRQVPDTQEVFLAPDSDLSLITEILELVKGDGAEDDLERAIRFHFSSLALDNAALSSSVTSVSLPPTPSAPNPQGPGLPNILGPAVLSGLQTISKFNRPASEADTVLILLALWRVPRRDADVTMCVNWPVKDGETGEERSEEEARRVFEDAVKAFEIKDFALFAGGEATARA
ncbi:ran-binding protein Mog1p [Rhodotorula toruloides]|uniref:Ran-binding protein Mog1p n=1 Tax=Rhodotorula toruloides TaxID=5286 RepID=A0A511KMQ7_RHOTO|nr:ran-binding protein Mog1p [Rhodotorula toruloides]